MRIMAPAGDVLCMEAAIRAGADEVYMGIAGFGARRFARNFSVGEYCEAVQEAHRYGVAVNVTLNTIFSNEEIVGLRESLEMLYAAGTDAVIVQDLGFAHFLRTHFPDWAVHASTQLSIASCEEARWAQEQGFSRLVLARELSLEEIAAIRKGTTAELEIFASGALCIACSGKCYLSSFIGGRSGNRGMCTQPCRQKYRKKGDFQERFWLSSCDQWQTGKEIRRLQEMGVEVIKLEGRMKSPAYVWEAVRYYRNLLDGLEKPTEIAKLFNRGYSLGYMYEHDPDFLNPAFSSAWGVPLGRAEQGGVRLEEAVCHGDGIVFLDADLQKIEGQNVSKIVRVKSGERVSEAKKGEHVHFGKRIPSATVWVYKTFDYRLNRRIETDLKKARRQRPVQAFLTAKIGEPLALELACSGVRATCFSEEKLEKSQKKRETEESLADALNRFGESPFVLKPEEVKIVMDAEVFVPRSILNRLRQRAVEDLEKKLAENARRLPKTLGDVKIPSEKSEEWPLPQVSVAVTTLEQAEICRECGITKIYQLRPPVHFAENDFPTPDFPMARLAGSLDDAIRWTHEKKPFALDWMFNAGNSWTIAYLRQTFPTAEVLFLSPELSGATVENLASNHPRKNLGLVVYGYLYGMYTRKTLFKEMRISLVNQDGRPVVVTRNAAGENRGETTGSRVYYGKPQDLLPIAEALPVGELRLDFTLESPEEVREILSRASFLWSEKRGTTSRPALSTMLPILQKKGFSYGLEKGIF